MRLDQLTQPQQNALRIAAEGDGYVETTGANRHPMVQTKTCLSLRDRGLLSSAFWGKFKITDPGRALLDGKTLVLFFDVKYRREVPVEPEHIERHTFPSTQGTRYALTATLEDGRALTRFVDRETWAHFAK